MALIRTMRFENEIFQANQPPKQVLENIYNQEHIQRIRNANPFSNWFWAKTVVDPDLSIDDSEPNRYYLVFVSYGVNTSGTFYIANNAKLLSAPNPPFTSTEGIG